MSASTWTRPVRYEMSNADDVAELNKLRKSGMIRAEIDTIDIALSELYDIHYPQEKDRRDEENYRRFVEKVTSAATTNYGSWFYYEWTQELIHFPPEADLRSLLTSRNRNLITESEQNILFGAVIFIAGMSVGSNVVEALVRQQVGSKLIIADFDVLEPTNLNRIPAGYDSVGQLKTDVVAKKVSKLNPYIELVKYDEGVNDRSIQEIMELHNPDILVDEIDSLEMKFKIREVAESHKKPVVMATDNGDGAILDIDRFDNDVEARPFGGRIPEEALEKLKSGSLEREEAGRLIGEHFVGFDIVPPRMMDSLKEVRKSLPSWPQLGSAAGLSGLLVAAAVKRILLGSGGASKRVTVSFEELLD